MTTTRAIHLFEAYGVELEYMIVDAASLDVRAICDDLLADAHAAASLTGCEPLDEPPSDYAADGIGWSNELVAHVVEFKTDQPVARLDALAGAFDRQIAQANAMLARRGACLLPSAMHPWMNPARETRLWPHDSAEFYNAFDRIFNCKGHGWANLQSVHLNLPFVGDDEFGRLHAAVRLVLPILPALAASSPVVEGRRSGLLDTRLDLYRHNCRAIPEVTGRVIPEPVFSEQAYRERIFDPMFAAIAPHDRDGILQHEWLNARGAIARFDRGTIEIRVLDVQECAAADLAVVAAATGVVWSLVQERWSSFASQQLVAIEPLEKIFLSALHDADEAVIDDTAYLALFGVDDERVTAGQLWRWLLDAAAGLPGSAAVEHQAAWQVLASEGPLARRILRALDADRAAGVEGDSREALSRVYHRLAACLAQDQMLRRDAVNEGRRVI